MIQNLTSGFYQEDLAYVHDVGYGEHARQAASFLVEQLKQKNIHDGLVIDLGCGSGILASAVSRQGYEVVGIDYSKDIVDIARRKAPQATFVVSSLYDYQIPSCDAVTAIGECVNYLFDGKSRIEKLSVLFEKIHTSLNRPGIFILDIVEPGILGENSQQKSIVEHEEWSMFLDYVEDREENTLERNILLFRKISGLYRKSKEMHRLKLYNRADIILLLEKAGFKVSVLDNYAGIKFREKHVGFLAEKKNH